MNLNSYILKDYLHIPILYTNLNSNVLERPLQSISFYQPDLLSDTHLAVIIQPNDLKKLLPTLKAGCFLCPTDHVFDLHSCKADIILIEGHISIFEIYEDLRKIFLEFEQLDQKMNQLVRQDAAINLFGNTLLKYLWNPISLYSEDMRLIFYSERKKPIQYQIYFEDELNQYLPDEEIEELKIDKEYNETINAFEPAIFSAARWGYRILFYNIRIDAVYVARLMILETDRPLKQSDYPLLVYLADFVTYMMDKKKLTLNNHPRFLDECLEALLQGESVKEQKLLTALNELGWLPDDRYLCATVLGSQFDKKFRTTSPVAIRIENALPASITLLKNDDIIVLINLTRSSLDKNELLQQLVYILREGLMKAGISREFSSLNLVRDFYLQTMTALSVGSHQDPMFWIFRYDNYALMDLMKAAQNNHCIESLIPSGLAKLMQYDQDNHRNFTEALKVYLRENMHIANTIKKLYLQRATFLYQLKRIQEISGLKLDDHKVRLELLIAFEIMDEMRMEL